MATHAVAQTRPSDGRVLKGRDLITIGIFIENSDMEV